MNVFIAGATGVLGRRITRELVSRGHTVRGLSRRTENDAVIKSDGGIPVSGDIFDADSLARAAESCEVIIHAATAIPVSDKFNAKDWEMNDRLRRDGTRALAEAAGRVNAKSFVFQSIVWAVRPPDQSPFDETAIPQPHSVYVSAIDGENIAHEFGAKRGFNVAILRCGSFYDPDSKHMHQYADKLRKRMLPVVAGGENHWHFIHTDDAARAFALAAEKHAAGTWHVVDDQPVKMCDFLPHLAELIGASPPMKAPEMMVRIVAGNEVTDYLMANTETSNAKLKRELGWAPQYPTYREGLAQVIAEWGKSAGAGA